MTDQSSTPRTSDILNLLGAGVLLSAAFLFPGATLALGSIAKFYQESKRQKDFRQWERYNIHRLRYILQRLRRQKIIEVSDEDKFSIVRLTEKGKQRMLKYQLEEMSLAPPKHWDRKWRLIIYDISKFKKREQNTFRRMLTKLKMLQLQKSVYLTPYPCHSEIEFLREYYGVGKEVMYIVADRLENEDVYKTYFGL